jgi:hypothetical protein
MKINLVEVNFFFYYLYIMQKTTKIALISGSIIAISIGAFLWYKNRSKQQLGNKQSDLTDLEKIYNQLLLGNTPIISGGIKQSSEMRKTEKVGQEPTQSPIQTQQNKPPKPTPPKPNPPKPNPTKPTEPTPSYNSYSTYDSPTESGYSSVGSYGGDYGQTGNDYGSGYSGSFDYSGSGGGYSIGGGFTIRLEDRGYGGNLSDY